MPSFADALGIHPAAVAVRSRRAEVLAANIANADTPGYQARDLDFRAALGAASATSLATTRPGHLASAAAAGADTLQYRQPLNASFDQNTVDVQAERAAYLDNALRYQASMTFLNGKIMGLTSAL
ncbi:MAG: flagellar basal body rod protein FlgB, partial [Gammaproteobacteria bacterium]